MCRVVEMTDNSCKLNDVEILASKIRSSFESNPPPNLPTQIAEEERIDELSLIYGKTWDEIPWDLQVHPSIMFYLPSEHQSHFFGSLLWFSMKNLSSANFDLIEAFLHPIGRGRRALSPPGRNWALGLNPDEIVIVEDALHLIYQNPNFPGFNGRAPDIRSMAGGV